MNPRLTRQELLRRGAAGGALLALPSLLAACGGGGGGSSAGGELNDVLNFSNWPYYIDTPTSLKAAGVKAPTTLEQFTTKTGIKVNYYEDINSNSEYFATVQGRLSQGKGIGRDIIVSTDNDRPLGEYISQGWAQKLDKTLIPNIANLIDAQASPAVRPEPGVHAPLVLGDGRDRVERGDHRARHDRHAAPHRPEAQGQGRRLELDGRHARARHARERRRSGEGHRRVVRPRARRDPEGPGLRARSAGSTATTTRNPSRRATSPRAWRGPATSSCSPIRR